MKAKNRETRGFSGYAAAFLLIGMLASGCAGPSQVAITSDPENAFVKVDGVNIGRTPITYAFNFKQKIQYDIEASREGFEPEKIRVLKDSPAIRSGEVNIVLKEDPRYKITAFSEATNTWRRIAIDKGFSAEEVWQRVVDSVTSVYDGLEQLDNSSGYIRSVKKMRAVGSGRNRVLIRTQFIGSFSGTNPLTYKYKIRSDTRKELQSEESWVPYERVFKNDAELSEELDTRLRVKGLN